MTDINDLPIPSILDMNTDEAIDYLRQIRLSRRTSVKEYKATKAAKSSKSKPKPSTLSSSQAAELLKSLEELQ